jgi:hypothetical protein
MTVNDFFRLLLKVFSFYWLVQVLFNILPGMLGTLGAMNDRFDWLLLLWIALVAAISIIILVILALKSDWIVEKLNLSKGFENNYIPFDKLDAPTILKLGCIITGGVMLLQSIPPALTQLYIAFQMAVSVRGEDMIVGYDLRNNSFRLGTSVVQVAVGFLLLTNYGWVSKRLAPRQEDNV